MRKLLALAALGTLGLGLVPLSAHADPLTPTVEGDGWWDATAHPFSNTTEVVWGCSALTTGGTPAASTGVSCVLTLEGVEIDRASGATPGHAVATVPRHFTAFGGQIEVCWTAQALLTNGELITDTTLPNCKS